MLKKKLYVIFAAFSLCFAGFSSSASAQEGFCSPNCAACPTCEFCDQNCTLSQGYWKNHTECWPGFIEPSAAEGVTAFADPETAELCGILWIDILNSPVQGRPWYNLAHQWIAAKLNQLNGADADCIDCSGCFEECEDAIAAAEALLTVNCANKDDKTSNAEFQCFSMLLEDFNLGMLDGCPAHCGGDDPCQTCDCGLCCPLDCNQCLDCPNICELAKEAGCMDGNVCCPSPCPEIPACPPCPACPACPACVCDVEQICPPCECVVNVSNECNRPQHHKHHHHHHYKCHKHHKHKKHHKKCHNTSKSSSSSKKPGCKAKNVTKKPRTGSKAKNAVKKPATRSKTKKVTKKPSTIKKPGMRAKVVKKPQHATKKK